MRVRFLLFIFAFVSVAAMASTDTWVVLKMRGGMTQAFLVPGQMTVKTEKDSLRLTSAKMEVAYEKHMVEGYFFQKDNDMPTDIEGITEKGFSVKYPGDGRVEINGIPTNTAVRIYGINGVEYKNLISGEDGTMVISLESLPRGTYIIRIEGVGGVKVKS